MSLNFLFLQNNFFYIFIKNISLLEKNYFILIFLFFIFIYNYKINQMFFYILIIFLLFFLNDFLIKVSFFTNVFNITEMVIKDNTKLLNGFFFFHPLFLYFFFVYFFIFFKKGHETFMYYFFLKKIVNKNLNFYFVFNIIFIAIFLGGWWAQQELNWGGWWNWDFIEYFNLFAFILVILLFHLNKTFFFLVYRHFFFL